MYQGWKDQPRKHCSPQSARPQTPTKFYRAFWWFLAKRSTVRPWWRTRLSACSKKGLLVFNMFAFSHLPLHASKQNHACSHVYHHYHYYTIWQVLLCLQGWVLVRVWPTFCHDSIWTWKYMYIVYIYIYDSMFPHDMACMHACMGW